MIFIFIIIFLAGMATIAFLLRPSFGKHPQGERLDMIRKSPYYSKGKFRNLNPTPVMAEDATPWKIMRDYRRSHRRIPKDKIPSVKTDLLDLDPEADILVWFGHSSYFMQLDGRKFLVDPVFSGAAGPLPFFSRAFKGTDVYTADDIPEIDYLFITHDHWDHLDYKTVKELKSKIKKVICSLGSGAHLEYWGFGRSIISEKDWNEEIRLEPGFMVHTTPARHFSGRGIIRNKTQWSSYVLHTPGYKIYIGGDSGYDSHFADIGEKFGDFDLAILENGQYNNSWRYIHSLPDQVLRAAKDLKAKRIFPVHSSKFALSIHPWDEPLKKIMELNDGPDMPIITPMIGETVNLNNTDQKFSRWWEGLE